MAKKKQRRNPWYKRIAQTIMEMETVDLALDGGGWTKVQELIALYMLRELNDADRFRLLPDYINSVDNLFDAAIAHIENTLGITVYKFKEEHKRNLSCITLKPDYKNAVEMDYMRMEIGTEQKVMKACGRIKQHDPQNLKRFTGSTIEKLLKA